MRFVKIVKTFLIGKTFEYQFLGEIFVRVYLRTSNKSFLPAPVNDVVNPFWDDKAVTLNRRKRPKIPH